MSFIGLKGNGLSVNILTNSAEVNGKTMSIEEFRQLCFQNNWEGTLVKVDSMLQAVRECLLERYGSEENENEH